MSRQVVKSAIDHHNQVQLDYYAGKVKNTMKPADSYYVNRHIQVFLNQAPITQDDRLLEVGCGMGKFTLQMLKRGFNITGLDLSPVLLQKLLEHNNNVFPIKLIASDILEIEETYNESFDHVIGFFTLHHFLHLETYLQAMARVLKPGGSIVFLEPNAFNPLYYFQIALSPTMSWAGDKGVAKMHRDNFTRAAKYANLSAPIIHKYGFFPPFVVNNPVGRTVENALEKMRIFNGVSAFQIVQFIKQ